MLTAAWEVDRFPAMGTEAHVVAFGGPVGLVQWARHEVVRLEARWSRFRPDSDVAALNRRAGSGSVTVAPETSALIDRAIEMWRLTEGLFDPTVLKALTEAGYDRPFRQLRERRNPASAVDPQPSPGCAGIAVDRDLDTVSLPRGVTLDLGGIGKGMAADLVATGLVARGAAGACVGLGGDIRTVGRGPDDGAWDIAVEDPRAEGRTLFAPRLESDAIVTSTTAFRRWTDSAGNDLHHLIDPRHGRPARSGVRAVVARAAEAWFAEAVAKAVLIAGTVPGIDLAHRLGVRCWICADEGLIVDTAAADGVAS